ncbi:MAG: hypothetical protein AAFZ05_00780 [Pseudomonadota bacterium]
MTENPNRFACARVRRVSAVAGALAASGLMMAGAGAAHAATPDAGNGRFMFTPIDSGVMRLDTRTGQMALCAQDAGSWSCKAVADETAVARDKLEALTKENDALKKKVTQLEDMLMAFQDRPGATPSSPGATPTPLPSPNSNSMFKLPSQKQVDQAFNYFENLLRKFQERLKRLGESPEDRGERAL